jgi:hypothetical protein
MWQAIKRRLVIWRKHLLHYNMNVIQPYVFQLYVYTLHTKYDVCVLQEYRTKLTTLQHELDTSESVQRDFVKLSQQLQMQLEKIRQSEQVCDYNA